MKLSLCLPGLAVLLAAIPASAVTYTWDGGGADNNIGTAANWNPDGAPATNLATTDLVFDGTARLSPSFNAAFSANSITFNNNAAANGFGFFGTALTIGTGGIANNDGNFETFNNSLTIGTATSQLNAGTGGLFFNNNITLGTNALTITGSAVVR